MADWCPTQSHGRGMRQPLERRIPPRSRNEVIMSNSQQPEPDLPLGHTSPETAERDARDSEAVRRHPGHQSTRKRRYFLLMGVTLTLLLLAATVVRFISVPAAVGMAVVAMLIPPFAAMVGNAGSHIERRRTTSTPDQEVGGGARK
jgi:Protein of unknown function (DUF3099)